MINRKQTWPSGSGSLYNQQTQRKHSGSSPLVPWQDCSCSEWFRKVLRRRQALGVEEGWAFSGCLPRTGHHACTSRGGFSFVLHNHR